MTERLTGFTLEIESRDEKVLHRLLDALWAEADRLRRETEIRHEGMYAGMPPLHVPLPFTGQIHYRSEIV